MFQDLRYGARILLKKPGFTLIVVITLALGIGANSAIFNVVSAFLIRPLPGVADAGRLIIPFEVDQDGDRHNSYSYPDYLDYRNRSQALDGLLTHRLTRAVLGKGEQSDLIYGELVSGNYFEVLRVRPQLGRTFAPDEDIAPNSHPVVIISYDLWRKRFAADPMIVGQNVNLNGFPFTIIGVAPADFQGTQWSLGLDFWAPMMMQERIEPGGNVLQERGTHRFSMVGRLKSGMTLEQAASDLTSVSKQLEREHPERGRTLRVAVLPETEGRWEDAASTVKIGSALALAVVGAVLLIVCANIANLLLARGLSRRKEIAVRIALGAGRWRLIRQLLTESVLLSLLGGAFGLLLSSWLRDLVLWVGPVIPYRVALDTSVDYQVILFTLVVSLLTGVVFGLAPSLQASKTELVTTLKGEEATFGGGRKCLTLRDTLVVFQVVLSLVVIVCAGLFVKSFQNARAIDPGFRVENIVTMTEMPGLLGYDNTRGREFYRQLVERVTALPGVQAASLTHTLPLGDSWSSDGPAVAEGQPIPPPGKGMSIMYNVVGPGYFGTLQIPILRGRDFAETDRTGTPRVAIINETAARRLWPNADPIGKRVSIGRTDPALYEIIGVARDGKYRSLGEAPRPFLWFPLAQVYENQMILLVRTAGEPQYIIDSVREAVKKLEPNIPLNYVKTMKQHLTWVLWGPQMGALVATAFGILAMLLAMMGIYSVIAYAVSQRTKEIGIRMALGAQSHRVVSMVAAQGMKLILTGVLIGLPLAFSVTRLLAGLLYDVSVGDPLIFTNAGLLLISIGLLATYLPARRAAKVDPMVALRWE